MLKKCGFIILLILSALQCSSQNQGLSNIWFTGYSSWAGLPFGVTKWDFYTGTPSISYYPIPMEFNHTFADISDDQGNLMFYTNGYYIADATNDTMQNGSGINPGAYADAFSDGLLIPQGCLILPKPANASIYYLFHNTADDYPNSSISYRLYLSAIDMNQNNGLGAVTIKNFQIITDSLNPGKITACKHANGRDWWIFCHRVNSNKYYKILLTPSGYSVTSQNIGAVRPTGAGQAKFSNNGEYFSYYYYLGGLDIFAFDRCSGNLTLLAQDSIPVHVGSVGEEFSSNSTKLYVSNITNIFQYDLTDTSNILATKNIVANWDTFYDPQPPIGTYLCLQQLGPDGKIYITSGNGTHYMHMVDSPDSLGLACNVLQHSVFLPTIYFNTLPNPPNYFLGPLAGSICDTLLGVNVNEIHSDLSILAFPNPAIDLITFSFPVEKDVGEILIYNILGDIVIKNSISPWSQFKQIKISQLKSGIYFCELKWQNKTSKVKFIKLE